MRFTYFRSSENNEEPLYFWLLPFNPLSARFCICPKAKPPVIEVIRDSEAGREVHAGIESLSLWTLISCSLLFWFHPHIILRRISTRRYLWRLSKFYLAGSEAKRNLCRWTNKMVTFIQFLLDECDDRRKNCSSLASPTTKSLILSPCTMNFCDNRCKNRLVEMSLYMCTKHYTRCYNLC